MKIGDKRKNDVLIKLKADLKRYTGQNILYSKKEFLVEKAWPHISYDIICRKNPEYKGYEIMQGLSPNLIKRLGEWFEYYA